MTNCFNLDNTIQYKKFVRFLYNITLKLRFIKYIYVLWSSTMHEVVSFPCDRNYLSNSREYW